MEVKKLIWNYLILGMMAYCLLGCESNKRTPDLVKDKIDKEALNSTSPEIGSIKGGKEHETWKIDTTAWEAFPHKWVGLERSSEGYIVYKPCDGVTPFFDLDSLTLKIDGQWQDGVIAFPIKTFRKLKENEYLIISEVGDWARLELNLKLVKPSMNLWLLNGFIKEKQMDGPQKLTWVVTTKTNSTKFPVIKNPCPTQKVPEKTFLPIEFEH